MSDTWLLIALLICIIGGWIIGSKIGNWFMDRRENKRGNK